MKKAKIDNSTLSTAIGSPTLSSSMPPNFYEICPTVLKQKLREKQKQKPIQFVRVKQNLKQRYNNSLYFEPARQEVNWIIYNMLVGIYRNWLRLAPYIIHLLAATKKDKIEDIQKLIERVTKDKQRIESLKNRQQFVKNINKTITKTESQDEQFYDENLLKQIQISCAAVKCSTQLLNGYVLGQKRELITEKQNLLANKVIQQINKNENLSRSKMIFVNQNVSKVVDTIVDRLNVIKYLKQKKIKINDKIMEPLRKVFQSSKYLQEDHQITTAKVIQKIKSKFPKFSSFNISSEAIRHKSINQNGIKDDHFEIQQNLLKNTSKISNINDFDDNKSDQNQYFYDKQSYEVRKDKSKKKIGFIINEDQYQSFLQNQVNIEKLPKNIYELYRQRKVVLNRQISKNKMKAMITQLKKTNNEKTSEMDDHSKQNKSAQKQQKNKKININLKEKNKAHQNSIKQIVFNDKQKSVNFINLSNRASKDQIQEDEDSQSSSQQGNGTRIRRYEKHKSKKYLKSGKLLKKRNLKRPSLIFDKINLENFDQQLKAQESMVNKKKKIIELFSKMEAQGIIKTKSLKKLVSYARNIQQQIRKCAKSKQIRRYNYSEDAPAPASFYLIPLPEQQNRKTEFQIPESRPFKFLTTLNKQAVQNWMPIKHSCHDDFMSLSKFTKGRFSGMNHDLNIPIIQKDTLKPKKKWFDKQSWALEFSQKLTKQINHSKIVQKSINIQKIQNLV